MANSSGWLLCNHSFLAVTLNEAELLAEFSDRLDVPLLKGKLSMPINSYSQRKYAVPTLSRSTFCPISPTIQIENPPFHQRMPYLLSMEENFQMFSPNTEINLFSFRRKCSDLCHLYPSCCRYPKIFQRDNGNGHSIKRHWLKLLLHHLLAR